MENSLNIRAIKGLVCRHLNRSLPATTIHASFIPRLATHCQHRLGQIYGLSAQDLNMLARVHAHTHSLSLSPSLSLSKQTCLKMVDLDYVLKYGITLLCSNPIIFYSESALIQFCLTFVFADTEKL